jgi:hypothetical protein
MKIITAIIAAVLVSTIAIGLGAPAAVAISGAIFGVVIAS